MATRRAHRTRVGKRNQVTIPARMLRDLGLGPGEAVEVVESGGTIAIRKAEDAVARLSGLLHRPGQPALSADEIGAAIRKEAEARAVRRNERSLQ